MRERLPAGARSGPGRQPFQLFEPVEHHMDLAHGRSIQTTNQDESSAVRCHVIGKARDIQVVTFEDHARPARVERWPRRDRHGHPALAVPIEELFAVPRPDRLFSAIK